MQDPLRQRLLTRMGIQSWQLRRPTLLGMALNLDTASARATETPAAIALPTGKLWLLAPALPAPALLADICQCLGLHVDEVALLERLPEGATPPRLWLTQPDPAWPDALICPLVPDGAEKRALWRQLQHLSLSAPG